LGARQVTFAVLATTATLVAVFVPISLLEGQVGRLFGEFGFVLAFAVLISTFVALSLAPPVAAAVLRSHQGGRGLVLLVDRAVDAAARGYRRLLRLLLAMPLPMIVLGGLASALVVPLYLSLPRELTPAEDRGVFFVAVTAPEGSNIAYTNAQVQRVLEVVEPLRAAGVAERIFAVSGAQGRARRGFVVVGLTDWAAREQSVQDLIAEVRPGLGEVAGAQAFPTAPAGLGLRGSRQPLQVVIGGPEFAAVEGWANQLLERLEQLPGLSDLSIGYEVNSPQLRVAIDRERANDLGISVQAISATLQTMLASREITTYVDRGREYPVIVQAAAADRRTPDDLANIFVRARSGDLVPLDALVTVTTVATSPELTRSDRLRSVGIGASLEPGMDLGRAIDAVVAIAAEILPPEARLSFGGQSKEYLDASGSLALVFALALLIVFLVLAAQFESFIHPVAIILAVPLALTGALASLWLTGNSLNVYTQIGIVLLVGLVAKNGILIIEFANQLRDEGLSVREAIIEGAAVRLRPVLMTVISTILGAVPLVLASGAGAEARSAIGIVIVGGLGVATLFNLIITPVLYDLLAGLVRPRAARSHALDAALARNSRHSPAE
jgi:multidrug efflux pump